MKTSHKLITAVLALGAASAVLVAQEDPQRPPREGGRPGGPGGPGGPRMMMPIVGALDANSDGVIDATEIANASAALKKLDKNGDGKLTPDEYRGQRPGGPGGPGGEGAPRRRPQPE